MRTEKAGSSTCVLLDTATDAARDRRPACSSTPPRTLPGIVDLRAPQHRHGRRGRGRDPAQGRHRPRQGLVRALTRMPADEGPSGSEGARRSARETARTGATSAPGGLTRTGRSAFRRTAVDPVEPRPTGSAGRRPPPDPARATGFPLGLRPIRGPAAEDMPLRYPVPSSPSRAISTTVTKKGRGTAMPSGSGAALLQARSGRMRAGFTATVSWRASHRGRALRVGERPRAG